MKNTTTIVLLSFDFIQSLRPTWNTIHNERMSYSGPIQVLFWSYCCHKGHSKCDAYEWLSYSALILVLLIHDGPLEMWVTVLFWSYSGIILVLLQSWLPTGNVMHMSDCPFLNNRQLHFLVIQSKAFSTIHSFTVLWSNPKPSQTSTASLSCDPIQSLLKNPQL
jgi:hypothetical protein